MKKYIALLLISAALLTACSSAEPETETETDAETETEAVIETEAIEETETETEPPEIVDSFDFYRLEAAKEPVIENGILVVYFTEDDIKYNENSVFYIGVRDSESAYSVKAVSQEDLYPDMITNAEKDYHSGVALLPNEEIPAGEYKMSVTFESFICEFDITVK